MKENLPEGALVFIIWITSLISLMLYPLFEPFLGYCIHRISSTQIPDIGPLLLVISLPCLIILNIVNIVKLIKRWHSNDSNRLLSQIVAYHMLVAILVGILNIILTMGYRWTAITENGPVTYLDEPGVLLHNISSTVLVIILISCIYHIYKHLTKKDHTKLSTN